MEKATFGAGCFWGVEQCFRAMEGVIDATVGYMGGHVDNPTYQQVCTDRTGHAEVCQVSFDPAKIDYADLVREFFRMHDPTQVNRQGPDVGTQYRSVIFVHDEQQRVTAERVRDEESSSDRYRAPLATSVEPVTRFWPAEDYHQRYLEKNGASCSISG
ncbi:peptide-methionine (S)-S-oxide reductase MsrA [Wenzhouxiangella sp. XN201]|nr:peptide-methionine (S)-S-oxide reductase MsrA [Wenzhouxiangella sp. XN201]